MFQEIERKKFIRPQMHKEQIKKMDKWGHMKLKPSKAMKTISRMKDRYIE